MKQHGKISLVGGTILLSILGLSGCVANQAYRAKKPVLRECVPVVEAEGSVKSKAQSHECQDAKVRYSLAFVEFDDMGEMYTERDQDDDSTKTELYQTVQEIRRLNNDDKGIENQNPEDLRSSPLFVVFIHGWKNNASDSSGNVWGFRTELQDLAEQLKPRPVMGIYIGWRGAVTPIPVAKEFSFWNRKNTATRIPGAHLTEALRTITMEAKSNPRAMCIVVGHSFGGLVLERTLTQAMVELILEHQIDSSSGQTHDEDDERLARRVPDLTVLLNEAGPATEAKEFLNFLGDQNVRYFDPDNSDKENNDASEKQPLFLSMTSAGDTATHIAFPAGQFLGKRSLRTRKYKKADEFCETDQNHYFLHTTANSARLVNHTIRKEACSKGETEFRNFWLGDTEYWICRDTNAANQTPYWVLQMPTEFVPDHSTIFTEELRTLLTAFLPPQHLRLASAPELDQQGNKKTQCGRNP